MTKQNNNIEKTFWHERWEAGKIGFHEAKPNTALTQFWHTLPERCAQQAVLVPLSGKTHDMTWLAKQGHDVLGIEFSEIAARDYFAELSLSPEVIESPAGIAYRHHIDNAQVTILVANFYHVDREILFSLGYPEQFALFYDRAAMIALPPQERINYLTHLKSLLIPEANGVLVSLDFNAPEDRQGPPYPVSEAEIKASYPQHTLLETIDLHQTDRNFKVEAYAWAYERVYRIDATQ